MVLKYYPLARLESRIVGSKHIGKGRTMTTRLVDHHRSSLEKLLAVEIEYQRKILALSNQRIQAIKKLLAGVDELHLDVEGSEVPDVTDTPTVSAPTKSSKGKKNHKSPKNKKAAPPAKPVRMSTGQVPRLIDALQMVIRNKKMRAKEAHGHLKARGWLPKSKDPLGYVRFTLSDESDIFLRVEGQRGLYHLDSNNPYYSSKSGHPKAKEVNEVEEPPASSAKSSPKAQAAPPPPVSGSEPPPSMSDADSHDIVQGMLDGTIPTD